MGKLLIRNKLTGEVLYDRSIFFDIPDIKDEKEFIDYVSNEFYNRDIPISYLLDYFGEVFDSYEKGIPLDIIFTGDVKDENCDHTKRCEGDS